MPKLPFTPKTTSFGTPPGTLTGSTPDTGVQVDTGLDTSGTLPGATTSDSNANSKFDQPTPSPALGRETGVDRRSFLRWGAAGTAGLLLGCGSKKQQKPQVQVKPGKETGDLKKHVKLPPDGLTDPAVGYETFVHPERTGPAIPKGFSTWAKIGIGIGAAASAVGAFFGIRAARKARYEAIEGPELKYIMKADQWHDMGESIQVRLATPVDGELSVTIDGIEEKLIRHFEGIMPRAKKRQEGGKYTCDIHAVLEEIGIKDKDERKATFASLKETGGAIDRGWLVKEEDTVGDYYYSTLTPYPRPNFIKRRSMLKAIRAKERRQQQKP